MDTEGDMRTRITLMHRTSILSKQTRKETTHMSRTRRIPHELWDVIFRGFTGFRRGNCFDKAECELVSAKEAETLRAKRGEDHGLVQINEDLATFRFDLAFRQERIALTPGFPGVATMRVHDEDERTSPEGMFEQLKDIFGNAKPPRDIANLLRALQGEKLVPVEDEYLRLPIVHYGDPVYECFQPFYELSREHAREEEIRLRDLALPMLFQACDAPREFLCPGKQYFRDADRGGREFVFAMPMDYFEDDGTPIKSHFLAFGYEPQFGTEAFAKERRRKRYNDGGDATSVESPEETADVPSDALVHLAKPGLLILLDPEFVHKLKKLTKWVAGQVNAHVFSLLQCRPDTPEPKQETRTEVRAPADTKPAAPDTERKPSRRNRGRNGNGGGGRIRGIDTVDRSKLPPGPGAETTSTETAREASESDA